MDRTLQFTPGTGPSASQEPIPGKAAARMLLFRGGGRVCALPVDCVLETMRPPSITPIPGAADFIRGYAIVRGAPLPVVDVIRLLEGPSEAARERMITVRTGDRQAGLLVETVLGIRELAGEVALPPVVSQVAQVRTIAARQAELTWVLDTSRLVPDEIWNALEERL